MKTVTLLYISLTGNTKCFVTKLKKWLESNYETTVETINVKDLKHHTYQLSNKFIAFLPTYLEGGNGVDTGDVEILTNPLGDFIEVYDNHKLCFGVVGSGNKNFNEQYCLTAKQYSERFGFPVLDDYELRGLPKDVERIGSKIAKLYNL